MGAVISLMALVVVYTSHWFQYYFKIQLNSEKEKLYNYEQRLSTVSYKITGNNEIRKGYLCIKIYKRMLFS